MKHLYREGKTANAATLLLLHGTGGTEHDLLSLAEIIDPNANVLSVRGKVIENGMPRFFKRLAEGVFDEEDLIARTEELNNFITKAASNYGFNRQNVIAIGYSNGANIAGSLLFHYQDALHGAILHHPMVPRRNIDLPNLHGKEVLITAGKEDPLCPPEESIDLLDLLQNAGANVDIFWVDGGHQLIQTEVTKAQQWYKTNIE